MDEPTPDEQIHELRTQLLARDRQLLDVLKQLVTIERWAASAISQAEEARLSAEQAQEMLLALAKGLPESFNVEAEIDELRYQLEQAESAT